MRGRLVPVVLMPRYTGLIGARTFTTTPVNVESFARAALTIWRGYMPGTSPTFTIDIQDSHDGETWTNLNTSAITTTDDGLATVAVNLSRRWLRVKVVLGGTNPAVSCWVTGFLEARVD
jgi:hypothetical protein